jgi:hypothetical protein
MWTHRITDWHRDFLDHPCLPLALEWAHGGGYAKGCGIWRWRGLPVLCVEAGEC